MAGPENNNDIQKQSTNVDQDAFDVEKYEPDYIDNDEIWESRIDDGV